MVRSQYVVVTQNGKWKISLGDKHYGPFKTQKEATKVAIDAAHKAGKNGHDAQVVLQGEDNQFKTEWTYGQDPYPPT